MPSNLDLMKEFHARFDPLNPAESMESLLPRRLQYLLEETQEVATAADTLFTLNVEPAHTDKHAERKTARAELIKELIDLLQVTYGFLHLLDVDVDAAFAEVHRSNMSKTPNPGGKAIKGEGYSKADMEKFA